MDYIITLFATVILVAIMILLVASRPRLSKMFTFWAFFIAVVGGLLVCSYGYISMSDNIPLAVLNSVLTVCGFFLGSASIPNAPALQTVPMQMFCTFLRICALYVTSSTVLCAIGAGFLQRLRLWMSRSSKLHLIYGTAPNAPDFGRQLMEGKQGSVAFVADMPDADYTAAVQSAGCVLRTDSHALQANGRFLHSVGVGRKNRQITLYAMDADTSANIRYARALLSSLQARRADPKNLHLVIFAPEDAVVRNLQVSADRYGYGFVTAVNAPQMTARLLTLQYPPCDTIAFDETGCATEDFEALVIGFGQVGQAVLKSLVMNGQFAGSTFRAAVFAPDCHKADGSFANTCGQLFEQYAITFHEADARSRQLYTYLNERGSKLKYVAVCTGSQKLNLEIGQALCAHLSIPVYLCSHNGVDACQRDGTVISHPVFSTDVLCTHQLDSRAMILNHRYQSPTDRSALECWMDCDYFSRQSCRASADFAPAMMRAAGQPEDWNLTESQLENLSITEHLRWCAFHYCMGFAPMSEAEFAARAETYRQQKAAGEKPLRIGKNMTGRTHACLISWDALDMLSEKEALVTGNYVNYKAMDTDNVLAIPQLLEETL